MAAKNREPGDLSPQCAEAEKAILAAILSDDTGRHLENACRNLTERDFYNRERRELFHVIRELVQFDKPVDLVSIMAVIRITKGDAAASAALVLISTLQEGFPLCVSSVDHYISIIKEFSASRKLASLTGKVLQDTGLTSRQRMEMIKAGAEEIEKDLAEDPGWDLGDAVLSTMKHIDQMAKAKEYGVSWGFPGLDEKAVGMMPGGLCLLGARPSTGKTTMALQIALKAAQAGKRVIFYSLEMSKEELMIKLLALCAEVNPLRVQKGDPKALAFTSGVLDTVAALPIIIDDHPAYSPDHIASKVARLQAANKIHLVIIDHAQLIEGRRGKKADSRAQELGDISRCLKKMTKTQRLPVLLLCQLNRQIESRKDAEPQLSDLRDSGSLEQDADQVFFIHRPDLFKASSLPYDDARIYLAKVRMGATGRHSLRFNRRLARFEEEIV